MKTNEFTKRMKAELNNENNVFNEFELKLYGVQAYGVTYGEEFNVIVKAARRANGRYYFITREGYEIAWSTLPAEKVEKICADMYDQRESDEKAARENYDRLKANGTAHIRAEIMNDVYKLADAEGVAVFMLTSGVDEINRIYYVCSLGTTADEGRAIARAAAADDHQDTPADRTHADRIGRAIARAAAALLLLVRVLFMSVCLVSGLAVMFGAGLLLPEITPDGFAACLLIRVPLLFAAVGAWCWIITKTVNHMPRRLAGYLGTC